MDRRQFFKSLAALTAAFALPGIREGLATVRLPAEPGNVVELTAWFNRVFKSEMIVPAPYLGSLDAPTEVLIEPDKGRDDALLGSLTSSPAMYPVGKFPVTWRLRVDVDDLNWNGNMARDVEAALCGATYRHFVGLCEANPGIVGQKLYWRRCPEVFVDPEFSTATARFTLRMRLMIVGLDLPSMEGKQSMWLDEALDFNEG